MDECVMIREPDVVSRERGFPRWAVEWGLYSRATGRSFTRRRRFLTRRAAERWIESKRIDPRRQWRTPESGGSDRG